MTDALKQVIETRKAFEAALVAFQEETGNRVLGYNENDIHLSSTTDIITPDAAITIQSRPNADYPAERLVVIDGVTFISLLHD